MTLHRDVRKDEENFARRRVGGKVHADAAQDKKLIREELSDVKITPKKRKRGGHVTGKMPAHRLDKRARGGRMGHKKGGTTNVIVQAGGDTAAAKQQGMQEGAQMGAKAVMAKMAQAQGAGAAQPRPPMPGAGAPPPGAPPGAGMPPPGQPPMMARKRGGKMQVEAGAGSGLGRLGKVGEDVVKVRAHKRRKGGRLEHADGGAC